MIRKEIFASIISDFQARPLPLLWERELEVPFDSGKIITLSGVRRSGKTFHLYKIIKNLLNRKVPIERIVYINFEDERLDITAKELDDLLQAYLEIYPDSDLSKVYFFFDEIQEVDGWEKFVIRLYNTISQHIFITGSNAKMLSREIATSLRGRTITYQVFPLSFKEYVTIKSPGIKIHTSSGKAKIISLFKKFLKDGGFPEVIGQKSEIRHKILQEYFNTMVLRDIVERYQISSVRILKYFCKRLVGASGGELSINKIYNELKTLGYKIGKDTLYHYLDYVDSVYLVRTIEKHTHSVVKSEMAQKKVYVIDSGMGYALDYKFSKDLGKLLETTIALEFQKSAVDVAYHSNGAECDFVVRKNGEVIEVVQVAWSIEDGQTKAREIRGLVNAAKKYGLKTGTILTLTDKDTISHDGIDIAIVPAWEYLMQGLS